MCEVTEDALCLGAINADYEECDRLGRRLGAVLAESKEVRITSPNGTGIVGDVTGRPVQYETGLFRNPGQFAAFPDSEINISPFEGTANGKIVSDVSIMSVGVTLHEHVRLIVKDGKVVDIQGGALAAKLSYTSSSLEDEKAYNYAEFGIGLNPCARLAATNLEDPGRLGNCHAGIGSYFAIGGKYRPQIISTPCIKTLRPTLKQKVKSSRVLTAGQSSTWRRRGRSALRNCEWGLRSWTLVFLQTLLCMTIPRKYSR